MPQKERKLRRNDNGDLGDSTVYIKTKRQPLPRRKPSASSVSISPLGFRMRRASFVSRRGGPTTPMPSWKVSDPLADSGHCPYNASQGAPVSARKLAASLWELQELLYFTDRPTPIPDQQESQYITINGNPPHQQRGQVLTPASSCFSQGSKEWPPNETKIAVDAVPERLMHRMKGVSVKDGSGAITTNELVKVLNHVWSLEEQHASSMSLVSVLRLELDQASCELQELLLAQQSHRKEVETISERISEERALWQEQLAQSIKVAVKSIKKELEDERKSKKMLQVVHKKLEKELRQTRKNLVRTLEDLERERKARELMDQVCDELAREISEDKARVEELKHESVKVREEVEEERKMLQMAEVWREERVQMKLMEAKLELEEKNTALEKLRSELELFLKARREGQAKGEKVDAHGKPLEVIIGQNLGDSFHSREHKALLSGRHSVDSICGSRGKQGSSMSCPSADDSDDDDDHDHDLHSIELNHEHGVKSPSGKWQQHTPQQQESESKKLLAGKSYGFEEQRRRENVNADTQGHGGNLPHSDRIRCGVQGDERREWPQDQQGESISLQQTKTQDSQSHRTHIRPEVMGRSAQAYSERLFRAASGSAYQDAMISRTW